MRNILEAIVGAVLVCVICCAVTSSSLAAAESSTDGELVTQAKNVGDVSVSKEFAIGGCTVEMTWRRSLRVRARRNVPAPPDGYAFGMGIALFLIWSVSMVFDYAISDPPTCAEVEEMLARENARKLEAQRR